jgi:hypothetical protein
MFLYVNCQIHTYTNASLKTLITPATIVTTWEGQQPYLQNDYPHCNFAVLRAVYVFISVSHPYLY